MDAKSIVIWILIGLVAGWLASFLVGGGGLVRYIVTGLIGSFVGGILVQALGIRLGLGNQLAEQIVVSAIGAVVVVLIARMIA
ncbi:GlsB/YeaQ/YmgE family stress response membrane protein [Prosthecomicrobium sp. N25]|uniref:GlsB/YeaQ/YmgE family stress response membrane protein n=1 Tax=Prosthecomicrobium sp. N25 TaxID=3129254 RepID=UPI003078436C